MGRRDVSPSRTASAVADLCDQMYSITNCSTSPRVLRRARRVLVIVALHIVTDKSGLSSEIFGCLGSNVVGTFLFWPPLGCLLSMDIDEIKEKVRADQYVYTHHAVVEARAESLTFAQVEEALLNGRILEEYPDSGRGESCLVVGLGGEVAVHAVCGRRGISWL